MIKRTYRGRVRHSQDEKILFQAGPLNMKRLVSRWGLDERHKASIGYAANRVQPESKKKKKSR
jgi:hypothetical protein